MQALSKGRSNLAPGKGEVGMETYEFFTFLVVFTVLIISVKRSKRKPRLASTKPWRGNLACNGGDR